MNTVHPYIFTHVTNLPRRTLLLLCSALLLSGCGRNGSDDTMPMQCRVKSAPDLQSLATGFMNPAPENRAWVYWFVMDGNLSREGIKADLEAMQRAGIGGVIFLEVNVGVPRGPVDFMSDEWIELFKYATEECERLGIQLTLISGPGWTGSGGPWVKPENAMHFIVADTISVTGGGHVSVQLPRPQPRKPYFGIESLTPEMRRQRAAYYEDLFVLAYPKPVAADSSTRIDNIEEKAIYLRHPYSSAPKTNPFLPMPVNLPDAPQGTVLATDQCVDVTSLLDPDGRLEWDAPAGQWVIYRFGRTLTGANTRPAPLPGVGFECSKMDTTALNHHLDHFVGRLMAAVGHKPHDRPAGWNMLHIDSWEMGTQNWTDHFKEIFKARRGYDLTPYLPTLSGQIVESREVSERFLWDFRLTSQELVLENHARHLRDYAHRYGFGLSIEPYDMSPNNDIALGGIADVPMGETWEVDDVFNTAFSCIEAVSAARINNRPIVGAEAFTSSHFDKGKFWKLHPGNMKNQTDWSFCIGINRLVFHRYAHQPWTDKWPGMTMSAYGLTYERTQTWWELSQSWHTYLARCQYLLRQGQGVADILFLTPEGAPHAFTPPVSAMEGSDRLPDKKGYNFDGCDPGTLLDKAFVRDGKICFPGGMQYNILALPTSGRMTPELLAKVDKLIHDGATVIGFAPEKSPSLTDYPACDKKLAELAGRMWGDGKTAAAKRTIGKGTLFTCTAADTAGMALDSRGDRTPYVKYETIATALAAQGVRPDFESDVPLRYIHRTSNGMEIYMVSNPSNQAVNATCTFRATDTGCSLWDAVQGRIAPVSAETTADGRSRITLPLEAFGSVFVVFSPVPPADIVNTTTLWPKLETALEVKGPWQVHFQEGRGAPAEATFPTLTDWSRHADPGIRYFSGIADYTTSFDLPESELSTHRNWYIDLGRTEVIARIELNGKPVTELWKTPFACDITPYLQAGQNTLKVSVANEWPNRLIGDDALPQEKRVTFTTYNPYKKGTPLLPSGLLGPVRVAWAE